MGRTQGVATDINRPITEVQSKWHPTKLAVHIYGSVRRHTINRRQSKGGTIFE